MATNFRRIMYVIKIMLEATVSPISRQQFNKWDSTWISPGVVGSVGDVVRRVRLKQSNPDLAMRYKKWTNGNRACRMGNNVQNGDIRNYLGNSVPRTKIGYLPSRRAFRTEYGERHQDIRAPDTMVEPFVAPIDRLPWRNQVAKIFKAQMPSNAFLPVPGPYELSPGELPRGGLTPTVVDVVGETDAIGLAASVVTPSRTSTYPVPVIPQGYGGNRTRAGVSSLGRQTMTNTPVEDRRMRKMR